MSEQPKPPAKDPLKSFRGVMAGTLIMEAIVVALALPVVAQLGGGLTSGTGWAVIAIAVVMGVLCGFLSKPWAVPAILVLQGALILFFFALPAIAVIGFVFLGLWLWLLWLRRDVARRMAEGRLPSQQEAAD
ncbi:DUF4233 domain-containing protein [Amycolatopsis sp. 195334CR]|uniref:DUF4233 domain-containing protein n=1 Tax=Amycolatopsis sp. 195334CR TaxID=2814588 RepID=UPI001A8F3493|nr:DUF4233 domain-containing protein [Amycolatopsis sp. 195334CR]MBN6037415.1 DUF4233 domain-containing protein [Amycolatopsis sp. 195334CR]